MSLTSPNLDDRDWRMLMQAARDRIRAHCPEWTDLSPSDPGVALVDVFAFLTEILIYRVNRIPEKAYVEFLRLLGVTLKPAAAAVTELELAFADDAEPSDVRVPARTAVRNTSGSVIFQTLSEVHLGAARTSARVSAVHGEFASFVRNADGTAGFELLVPGPGIADGPHGTDLEVLVEAVRGPGASGAGSSGEVGPGGIAIDGRTFVRWTEVESFAEARPTDRVFVADRHAGRIQFAPARALVGSGADAEPGASGDAAALAAIPRAGAQVRVTWLRGGGAEGNVRPGELTELDGAPAGVVVRQPERALGGRAAETLEQALRRGPLELRRPFRAVTARDYETVAQSLPVVDRARAFTQRELWDHAQPGTVEVAVVAADGGTFGPEALARVSAELERRKPLGTRCVVRPAGAKEVAVRARLVVHAAADPAAVRERVVARIGRLLDPRRAATGGGEWPFGRSLHVSRVYEACLAEPGVVSVDEPELVVVHAPGDVLTTVAADSQSGVFYVASGAAAFRSVDGGDGWELVHDVTQDGPRATVRRIVVSPFHAGCVALVVHLPESDASVVYTSRDCGQSWPNRSAIAHPVHDVAWTEDEATPMLLLATQVGLFRNVLRGDHAVEPVLGAPQSRLYAVAVSATESARRVVAVGTRKEGVHFSPSNAADGSFKALDAPECDVRELAFQELDGHTWLWAGLSVPGKDSASGLGALRWSLGVTGREPGPHESLSKGWTGREWGSCSGLAFVGPEQRFALATTSAGQVAELDCRADGPRWVLAKEDVGIGYIQEGELAGQRAELVGLAAQRRGAGAGAGAVDRVLVASEAGLYRADLVRPSEGAEGDATRFVRLGVRRDVVTIPATWTFRGGAHAIVVEREGEA
jgi:hypothetical protein